MWAYQLGSSNAFARIEIEPPTSADLRPGEVVVKLAVGGICGSDVGRYALATSRTADPGLRPGHPLHEIAGTVTDTRDERFTPGDRVVGYAKGLSGLREYVVTPADTLTVIPPEFTDVEAIAIQPLATVLFAVDRLPPPAGREVAVVGLGPIGLLFAHVLHDAGARVLGVDPVDRGAVAGLYGIDEPVVSASTTWIEDAGNRDRFPICVEAVGHQTATLDHAIRATAPSGHVYFFGVPDDDTYPLPLRAIFDKNLTIYAGTTRGWDRFLGEAAGYLLRHRELLGGDRPFVTHVLPSSEVQQAFTLCATAAPDRRKVVLVAP